MEHKDFGVRAAVSTDPETVTIEHDQWGRVDGVGRNMESCRPLNVMWEKDGACYTEFHGWREVKPTRWVPCEGIAYNEHSIFFQKPIEPVRLPDGYRWKTVEIEREEEG